MKLKKAKIK